MKKKTFALISGIVTGATTIAIAVVTNQEPPLATEINAAITIVSGAIIQVCNLFVVPEPEKPESV